MTRPLAAVAGFPDKARTAFAESIPDPVLAKMHRRTAGPDRSSGVSPERPGPSAPEARSRALS